MFRIQELAMGMMIAVIVLLFHACRLSEDMVMIRPIGNAFNNAKIETSEFRGKRYGVKDFGTKAGPVAVRFSKNTTRIVLQAGKEVHIYDMQQPTVDSLLLRMSRNSDGQELPVFVREDGKEMFPVKSDRIPGTNKPPIPKA